MRVGLVVEALGRYHRLAAFDCRQEDLTGWLQHHAAQAVGQGTRTYVLVEEGHPEVLGYFSLVPHVVEREQLPRRVGRGAPRQVPAILLAKFALDTTLQGRGLGSELLVRALSVVLEAARTAGGKLVVVDAIDAAAASFYEHHDFLPVPEDPSRLVMKLSSAAKALGVRWP